jgi:Domain of unknown function (DUF4383)
MTLLSSLGHHRAELSYRVLPLPVGRPREPVYAVQRVGAVTVGVGLLVFGLLGLTGGVPFLSTEGHRVLGLSSNGLLATVSLAVAAVLLSAAARGPRVASTAMIVLGALFLLSALVNTLVVGTSLNLLAFQVSNVVFSGVVGSLLLVLGAYGRLGSNLPIDSPYAHPRQPVLEPTDLPSTPAEVAAEAGMRAAEIAVVQHCATEHQQHLVHAMAQARTRAERRRVWIELQPNEAPGTSR